MRAYLFLFLCFSMFYAPVEITAQVDLLRKEIDKFIKYEQSVDFNVVPGIAIGVIDGDSTFRLTYGRNIDADGIFEMGSLTKPIVAWLANEALVSLGTDRFARVCQFVPDSLCHSSWEELTYDQVIEHKTGLVRLAPGIGEIETDVQDPYEEYSIDLLSHDLRAMHPLPGKYSYSHMGYALTHWLFERVGGLSEFTREHLAVPYQMTDTKWELPADSIEQGHGLDGRPQPPWNTNALKPALGLRSTLNDLMTFLEILFEGYERNSKRHPPGNLKKELRSLSKIGAYKVVDGWFVIRAANSLVYYHNGRTGGHHVSVAFIPHKRKGVVIISNGAMGSNDLSLLILRMVNQAKRPKK